MHGVQERLPPRVPAVQTASVAPPRSSGTPCSPLREQEVQTQPLYWLAGHASPLPSSRSRPPYSDDREQGGEAMRMPATSHVCPKCTYEHPCFFTEGDIVSLKEDLVNEPAPWTGIVLEVERDRTGRVYRILWGPPPSQTSR